MNPVTNKIYVANFASVYGDRWRHQHHHHRTAGDRPVAGSEPRDEQDLRRQRGSNNVTVIDGATNSTTTVQVGIKPQAVAVNPVTNKIYVANATATASR